MTADRAECFPRGVARLDEVRCRANREAFDDAASLVKTARAALLKAAWAIADSGHIASEDDWQAALTVVSEATDEELEAYFNCHP